MKPILTNQSPWRLIPPLCLSGQLQMAIDQWLLEKFVGAGFTDNVLSMSDNLTKPALVGKQRDNFDRWVFNNAERLAPFPAHPDAA